MRIVRLWLDGYGRFKGRELGLHPGFQVVAGPNERGKSTIRDFIGDMLYGQKRSATQRTYEDNQDLRRPWLEPQDYAGRMQYVLDNGHEIEVQRIFDKRRESVRVFDRTLARDITADFPLPGNREPAFGDRHLGVSKRLFSATAVVNHLTLEHLGDEDALSQIREKILSLADSAEESRTAESALAYIEDRIGSIGRPTARSKPLPAGRARLAELDREHALATAARQDVDELESRCLALHENIVALQRQRAKHEAELGYLDRAERAQRLQDAERYQRGIDEMTQTCFALSAVREFPLEKEPELQRLINVLNTARTQLRRTEGERAEVQRQLDEERGRLGGIGAQPMVEESAEVEQRLADLESSIARLTERLEQVDVECAGAKARLDAALRDLGALPDFDRAPPNPMEWLGSLASSFEGQRQARERERQSLERLRDAVGQHERRLVKPREVFEKLGDFPAEAADYHYTLRTFEEKGGELQSQIDQSRSAEDEQRGSIPSFRNLTILCVALTIGAAVAGYLAKNSGAYIAAGLLGMLDAYFFVQLLTAWTGANRTRRELRDAESKLAQLEDETARRRDRMERALAEAGYTTIRELEALYECYTKDRQNIEFLKADFEVQNRRTRAQEQQVDESFAELVRQFKQIGIDLRGEDSVREAANAGMSKYQEYRDAKLRMHDNRDKHAKLEEQAREMRSDLEAVRTEDRNLSLEVRQRMRDHGFRDESRFTSALKALRAYRDRSSQVRAQRGRTELLEQNRAGLDRQIDAERRDLEKQEDAMQRFLRAAGAQSIEHWREMGEQAKTYREAWRRRTDMQDALDTLLRGETLENLRALAEAGEAETGRCARTPEEVRSDIERISKTIDAHTREENALRVKIAERSSGHRSLNDIEEERALTVRRVEALAFELEAAVYAAAVIEEVANDRHARIAPGLAASASRYLSEITDGVYQEILISRDLCLTVRIPQTSELNESPERRLSKGTVDQIYLALRLALVENLSQNGERIPILLDDPLANYDDSRLARTLLLLSRVAQTHQVILFTCHEEVARAATAAGASVLIL